MSSRFIPRLFARLLLALSIGACLQACCGASSLRISDDLPLVESILDRETLAGDRVSLYSLPACCWPENEEEGELLPTRASGPLFTGLDAVSLDRFALLRNRSFALLTNATGRDRTLTTGLELMIQNGVRPALVFEPEHGLYGALDRESADGFTIEPRFGLRVLSLYSARRKPDPAHLEGIDLIVVDIDNLPVRCYTYISTLTYLLEISDRLGIEVLILDRPNPYGFWKAQGSYLNEEYRSFVAEAPTPFLYSLTPGEYARFVADLRYHQLKLSIVRVAGYERDDRDAPLRRSWINPSPNIPSLEAALIYPGLVFFEGVDFSLGRGTTRPFVYSGAPWLNSAEATRRLRALNLPGVQITETAFEPTASVFRGRLVHGVQITPTSRSFDPLRTGYEYMRIVRELHPDEFRLRKSGARYFIDSLWGGPQYREAIEADLPYAEFRKGWAREAEQFEELVEPYRLY